MSLFAGKALNEVNMLHIGAFDSFNEASSGMAVGGKTSFISTGGCVTHTDNQIYTVYPTWDEDTGATFWNLDGTPFAAYWDSPSYIFIITMISDSYNEKCNYFSMPYMLFIGLDIETYTKRYFTILHSAEEASYVRSFRAEMRIFGYYEYSANGGTITIDDSDITVGGTSIFDSNILAFTQINSVDPVYDLGDGEVIQFLDFSTVDSIKMDPSGVYGKSSGNPDKLLIPATSGSVGTIIETGVKECQTLQENFIQLPTEFRFFIITVEWEFPENNSPGHQAGTCSMHIDTTKSCLFSPALIYGGKTQTNYYTISNTPNEGRNSHFLYSGLVIKYGPGELDRDTVLPAEVSYEGTGIKFIRVSYKAMG